MKKRRNIKMQAEKNIAIRTWLKWKWYIKPEVTQAELVL